MYLDHVFHPSDFTEASEVAFAHALGIARKAASRLTVLHVANQQEDVEWTDFPRVRETLKRWGVADGSESGSASRLLIEKAITRDRDPVVSILRHLDDSPADLIVLATHQRGGIERWTERATALPTARKSHVPTLYVPHGSSGFVSLDDGSISLRRVLVPVGSHPSAQPAIDASIAIATVLAAEDVTIRAYFAGDAGDRPAIRLRSEHGYNVEEVTTAESPVEGILAQFIDWSPDLVVMSTEGRHGFLDAFRGSTTERVLRDVPCPLLGVPVR